MTHFEKIIGQDYRMVKVFDLIEAVADSKATVLITGESGTGKSLVARAIHDSSDRREKPFVEVSCGALPEMLLESELFGHVRGAFTDAFGDR
ncbi:MAG: sigma 54-interacting transcriptional regulator, partial [Phycisphaerae bacterium]|nr:sigma 54-interacting transcriptional regulator [Phycisphaerae bacterium]